MLTNKRLLFLELIEYSQTSVCFMQPFTLTKENGYLRHGLKRIFTSFILTSLSINETSYKGLWLTSVLSGSNAVSENCEHPTLREQKVYLVCSISGVILSLLYFQETTYHFNTLLILPFQNHHAPLKVGWKDHVYNCAHLCSYQKCHFEFNTRLILKSLPPFSPVMLFFG